MTRILIGRGGYDLGLNGFNFWNLGKDTWVVKDTGVAKGVSLATEVCP